MDQASCRIDHRASARGAVCSDDDSGAKSNYDHSCAGNHDNNCAADDDRWADDDPRSNNHQGNHVTSRRTGFRSLTSVGAGPSSRQARVTV